MRRVRRRVIDTKLNRLVLAYLKAGILSEAQFTRSPFDYFAATEQLSAQARKASYVSSRIDIDQSCQG